MKCSRIGMLLVLGLGAILKAADAYTFTSLEVPGGTQTNATGINDLGTIVGFYFNNPLEHGFALQKGTYTTLDVPGSPLVTSPRGINFQGDIVGQYALTAGPNSHGFVFQGSVFTTIDFPGAQQTTASGINSRDEIVGGYVDNNARVHGFLREKDHYAAVDVPFPGASGTFAIGINDSGEIVGFYLESNGSEHGFIRKGSDFHSLDVPFPGVLGTNASGINNKGEIVGTYLDSDGLEHGFVLSKGVYTRLDARFSGIPDVNPQTAALGINDLGEIVGTYTSAPGTSASSPPIVFGFLAKPAGPEFVYVANANSGTVSGYAIDPTTGALTPINGSPFAAGLGPFSVAVDPTAKFAYVANEMSNNVSGYTIDQTTGALTTISGSPFAAGSPFAPGLRPFSITVDPTGKFAYVANNSSSNISGFTIDAMTGALTAISGSPFASGAPSPFSVAVDPTGKFAYVSNFGAIVPKISGFTIDLTTGALTAFGGATLFPGTGPVSVAVDPTGKFAYVANFNVGNVSGYTIDPTTGALTAIRGSPFAAGGSPRSVAVARPQ